RGVAEILSLTKAFPLYVIIKSIHRSYIVQMIMKHVHTQISITPAGIQLLEGHET
ncbi:hypothetical protein Dsin_006878, partial [Dipteronia sinensis]